jgi:hypothetical protein
MRTCRKRTEHSCQRRGGRRRGNRPALTDAGDTGRGGHRTDERTALLMHEPTGFALLRCRRSACGCSKRVRSARTSFVRSSACCRWGSATCLTRCGGCTPRSSPQVRSTSAACVHPETLVCADASLTQRRCAELALRDATVSCERTRHLCAYLARGASAVRVAARATAD